MTFRILSAVLIASAAGGPPLAAQQATIAPRASVLFAPSALPAPDSAAVHPTYWREGALLGGIPLGILGAIAANGLCAMDDSVDGGRHCGIAALGGAALGFLLGAIPGALIGGQIEKKQ